MPIPAYARAPAWLLSLMLLPGGAAHGFVCYRTPSGVAERWNLTPPFHPAIPATSFNPSTGSIRYYLAADGWSQTNTVAELNAARAAFAQWQLVPGTNLRFEDAGTVQAGADVNTADGTNVVFWAKSSLFVNGGRDYIGGTLGVTFTRLEGESLAEADIVLNGIQQRWFTDATRPDSGAQFAEGIVLHEIGHWLGLAHSPVGAATLFARGDTGLSLQAGLSPDEFAAARALYPDPAQSAAWGSIRGRVTRGGSPVFGAVLLAESPAAGVLSGTLSAADGTYELAGLPAGPMTLRVAPLDAGGLDYLVRGSDIGADWTAGATDFGTSAAVEVAVASGGETVRDLTVAGPRPDFWIGYLRVPTASMSSFAGMDGPVSLKLGQTGQYVGVYSRNLPTNGVELILSGDGLTVGPTLVHPDPVTGSGLRAISALVDVAAHATPGLRTVLVRRVSDGAVALAGGFLAVEPALMDWNLDGFDDAFQRRWFPLFTASEAAPNADPDRDGMRNADESVAGTNPTNALSLLRMEAISAGVAGTTLTWSSVRFKRYQLWVGNALVEGTWSTLGAPIRATNSVMNVVDPSGDPRRFYRIQALP
jgi:hypothetical protein